MDTETIIMRLIESDPSRESEFRLVQHIAESVALEVRHLEAEYNLPSDTKYVYDDLIIISRWHFHYESTTGRTMPSDHEKIISEANVLALRILNS